tara:strand:+ start:644 stop:877 length:234 start_codon:yes stop_codon:yes gene_type:complete
MAYTRQTIGTSTGLKGQMDLLTDGSWGWYLKETFRDGTMDHPTAPGTLNGTVILDSGYGADFDTAAAALKAAVTAAG